MPKADSSSPARSPSTSTTISSTPNARATKNASSHATKGESKGTKPRLTAHQKNTNHKDAENKRRTAIRDQFLALSKIVPDTKGLERSEQVMLTKTVEYLKEVMEERRRLVGMVEARGGSVEEGLKMGDNEWGGRKWKGKGVENWNKRRSASKRGEDED